MRRRKLLSKAVDDCLKEIYSYAVPKVDWEEFLKQNKIYNERYRKWETLEKIGKPSLLEYCGPKPYEFYYIPKDIMKDICDSYIQAYRIDSQQELLNTIEILKNYCKEPIVDKYIKKEGEPGYRSYAYPDNLEKEIDKIITNYKGERIPDQELLINNIKNKFFEFLDMAGNFYNWNYELNSFNISVYLGPSPNSNKQAVIDNWKKYRKQDIKIDEEQIKKDYYGDDE